MKYPHYTTTILLNRNEPRFSMNQIKSKSSSVKNIIPIVIIVLIRHAICMQWRPQVVARLMRTRTKRLLLNWWQASVRSWVMYNLHAFSLLLLLLPLLLPLLLRLILVRSFIFRQTENHRQDVNDREHLKG